MIADTGLITTYWKIHCLVTTKKSGDGLKEGKQQNGNGNLTEGLSSSILKRVPG